MKTRYLIVADALDRLNPVFDLGVCVSVELVRRGIEVDYLDLYASDAEQSSSEYLSTLPVRTIYSADSNRSEFWELGPESPGRNHRLPGGPSPDRSSGGRAFHPLRQALRDRPEQRSPGQPPAGDLRALRTHGSPAVSGIRRADPGRR